MIRPNSSSNDNFNGNKGLRKSVKRPLSDRRILRYDSPLETNGSLNEGAGGKFSASKDADMEVTGAGFVGGAGAIRPIQPSAANGVAAAAPSGLQAPRDEIMISDAARSLGELQMDPQVRAARLAEIKTAIDSGTYDTPQRLEAAIEKMIVAWSQGR
jgi:anti-sigma28 factor (negative regulator of flagellin synthesis)